MTAAAAVPSPSSPAARAASGSPSPQALARAGFDLASPTSGASRLPVTAVEHCRRRRCKPSMLRCDLAALDDHDAAADAVLARSAGSTAWSTMPASARSVRGDLLDLCPGELRPGHVDVNLRGTVFLTQAVARRMLACRQRASALDHHHHLGQRRPGLARARRLLHLQGRPFDVGQGARAAARRRRHRRLRGPARASSAPT